MTPSLEEAVLSFFRRTEIILQVVAGPEPEAVMPENQKPIRSFQLVRREKELKSATASQQAIIKLFAHCLWTALPLETWSLASLLHESGSSCGSGLRGKKQTTDVA